MTKKAVAFESILGELIAGYIEEKRAVGYKYIKASSLLKQFDTLATREHLGEKNFPRNWYCFGRKKDQMKQTVAEMEGSQ
jgi:hypothetical protein